MNTHGLMPKELDGAVLVERKLYYFADSHNRLRRPIPSCKHNRGRNLISTLEHGSETVATLEACVICGRVLPPRRVTKAGSYSALPLSSQTAAFNRLTSFIMRF